MGKPISRRLESKQANVSTPKGIRTPAAAVRGLIEPLSRGSDELRQIPVSGCQSRFRPGRSFRQIG